VGRTVDLSVVFVVKRGRVLIDHLIYAAPDLMAAIDDLEERFGVRAQPAGKHVGVGTHNALIGLGGRTYLDIIAPDFEQPPPSMHRPFGLDRLAAARLAAWAVPCDDIDAAITQARSRRYDPGDAVDMQRIAPTGSVVHWRMTLNAFEGGPVPFLIAWGDTEHPSRSAPQGLTLDSFELAHPEPAQVTPILAAIGADIEVNPASHFALVAQIRGPHGVKTLP
jgi:Glyoxalase-like domain